MSVESKVCILLVEDDLADVLFVNGLLNELGRDKFSLSNAGTLKEALKLIKKKPFDIILLDLNLPDSTGLATITKMIKEVDKIPIVLTVVKKNEISLKALKEGVQDYLIKGSINSELLGHVINYAIARMNFEANIKQKTSIFNAFLNSVNESATLIDTKGNIILINKEAAHNFKSSVDDLIGKNLYLLLPRKLAVNRKRFINKVIKTKKPFSFNDIIGEFSFENRIYPIIKNGKVTQLATLSLNVTERIKRANELRDSEETYRTIYNSSSDAILILKPPKWNFISGNHAIFNMFKVKSEKDFTLTTPWGLSPKHQPDKELSSVKAKRMIMKAMKEGSNYFEWTHKRITGEEFPSTVSLTKMMLKGEFLLQAIVRDITEQKKAEDALRESEAKYKELVEETDDLVQICSLDGGISYVNTSWFKKLGYNEGDVKRLNLMKLLSPESINHCMKLFKQVISGKSINNIETVFLKKDGSKLYVLGNIYPRFHKDKVIAVQGIFTDITEQKKTESLLQLSEKKFRLVFDNTPDGFLIADNKTKKFTSANKAITKMLGYSPDEIKTLNVFDIHPKKDLPYVLSQFEKQVKGKITLATNIPVLRKDGTVFYADINSFLLIIEGKTYLAGIFRDVTEKKIKTELLKKSEEEYKSLFNSANDTIVYLDLKGKVLNVNPIVFNLIGLEPEEVIGHNLLRLGILNVKNLASISNLMRESIVRKGDVQKIIELEMKHKNGSKVYVEIGAEQIKKEGKLIGFLGVIRDITERKENEQLRINSESEKKLQQLRNEFLILITHDLKQPLTPIIGYTEIIKDELKKPNNINYADKIISQAFKLQEMIDKVLNLVRIESKSLQLNIKKSNIKKLIDEVIHIKSQSIDIKRIKLVTHLKDAEALADTERLKDVLINCFDNSVKFSKEDGKIEIKSGTSGGYAYISIKDYGVGIRKEDIPKIFNKFFQTKEGREAGGTGVGLAICKELITAMKGQISVKSEYGKNTEFTIKLPLKTKK